MAFKIKEKPELKAEDVNGKMTWNQVFNHYFPSMTHDEIDFLLFEHTCYPMDSEQALKQVYEIYQSRLKNAKTLYP